MNTDIQYHNKNNKVAVPEDVFNKIKNQTLWLLKNKPNIFDCEIYELLKDINGQDGYTTTWSCSAHPEKEDFKGDFYIMLVIREDIFDTFLSNVIEFITPSLKYNTIICGPDITVNLTTGGASIHKTITFMGIPSWRLSADVYSKYDINYVVIAIRKLLQLN